MKASVERKIINESKKLSKCFENDISYKGSVLKVMDLSKKNGGTLTSIVIKGRYLLYSGVFRYEDNKYVGVLKSSFGAEFENGIAKVLTKMLKELDEVVEIHNLSFKVGFSKENVRVVARESYSNRGKYDIEIV